MSASEQRRRQRQQWFDRGAEILAHAFPRTRDIGVPVYACPLCLVAWPVDALDKKILTAEDVPPRSVGGRPMVLTCHRCNHTAGSGVDAEARKRENVIEFQSGKPVTNRKVVLSTGNSSVQARLTSAEKGWQVMFPERANSPDAVVRFTTEVGASKPLTLNLTGDAFKAHHARVSWLKSGYLAMFALFGYEVVFAPSMNLVRRQIQTPNEELIPTFLIVQSDSDISASRRHIVRVSEPSWLECWAVVMGRYIVMLPDPTAPDLYERIKEHRRASDGLQIEDGRVYGWPERPWERLQPPVCPP